MNAGRRLPAPRKAASADEVVIRKRLETYECETKAILEYYRKKLTVIDATQCPIEVLKQIINAIAIAVKHHGAAA